jgi:hypothetical protein
VKHCTQCGHVLGLGRFCTNCGHPVAARLSDPLSDPLDLTEPPEPETPETPATRAEPAEPAEGTESDWRTDTAARPTRRSAGASAAQAPASPRVPPAATEPPPPPRFPLFADEVAVPPAPSTPETVAVPVAGAALASWEQESAGEALDAEDWDEEDWDEDWEGEAWDGRRRALRIGGAVAVLAALVAGAWFLGNALGGDDEPTAQEPSGSPSEPTAEAVDHTAEASAEAPRTAPPNQDVDGNPTSYDASNMLDGVPETAWRAAGDGEGLKIVFTFPEKTRITEVGLVNGYAKEASDESGATIDWYAGHRRIEQVTWNLGGDVVRQDLVDDRKMQTLEVEAVEVRKIVLKIVSTTPPGDGPSGRDFTAISDVLLAG